MKDTKKVIIIGGGPAGLTAAYELLDKGAGDYAVEIWEESDMLGGISRTVQHNGNRMDIGGHRFFSKDDHVMQWWKEMLPMQGAPSYDDKKLGREKPLVEGGPDPETTDEVMLLRQRVSRIYYHHKFFDYPISMKWDTIRNLGFATTMKAGFSYLGARLHKRPEDSLENFYINSFGKKLYSMFFEGYTEKLWGRHPSEIDASWGAQRTKGLSIGGIVKDVFKKVFHIKPKEVNTSLIEQFIYPKFGPGQLWEYVGAQVEAKGGKVLKGRRVTALQKEGDRIVSVTYEQDGITHTEPCDIVISSMPLKDLVAGFGADVPDDVKRIAAGLPYRDFVTVGLLVNRLDLKNETDIKTLGNIVPDCWIYVQDEGVKLGRIQVFNNWSPYMVKNPDETVWIGLEFFCTEGDAFWTMDEAACVDAAVKELRAMGVLAPDTEVLDSHREHVKKAYPAYFDTYDEIDTLVSYLNEIDNLYCVGRNGQHRYNNMDHSMVTSFETVKAILSGSRDRTPIWQVNTEEEYHEQK